MCRQKLKILASEHDQALRLVLIPGRRSFKAQIWLLVMLSSTAFVHTGHTASYVSSSSIQSFENFYQQLSYSRDKKPYRAPESVFSRMANRYPEFDTLLVTPEQEEELVHNYLWVRQYQDGYKHHDGSDAANRLFRLGVKALYKTYYKNSRLTLDSDSDIGSSFSDIQYKLGVSTDRVRLKFEYDF